MRARRCWQSSHSIRSVVQLSRPPLREYPVRSLVSMSLPSFTPKLPILFAGVSTMRLRLDRSFAREMICDLAYDQLAVNDPSSTFTSLLMPNRFAPAI